MAGGLRYNQGKPRLDLLHPDALIGVADVLTEGARKYAERNWELGMEWSKPYASLLRHLLAFWSGEDFDPESGKLHVDHIATNAHFLQVYARRHKALDDRPIHKTRSEEVRTSREEGEERLVQPTEEPRSGPDGYSSLSDADCQASYSDYLRNLMDARGEP